MSKRKPCVACTCSQCGAGPPHIVYWDGVPWCSSCIWEARKHVFKFPAKVVKE